ncbi:MAG: hypothetical protein E3J72_00640 [Planctomycetota bacterium]|nr:MAG: hypothetical protein E3J72_00640 [Planctomycetota bacterium]
MKPSLPVKLAIFVVLLFVTVITTCLLWTPIWLRWYSSKFFSINIKKRVEGVEGLLAMGKRGKEFLLENFPDGKEGAEFLIKHWRDFNTEIKVYESIRKPVFTAAEKGYAEVIALFIAKGADAGTPNDWRVELLLSTVYNGNDEIAEILIEAGTELNNKYPNSSTPLDVAFQNYNYKIAKMLHLRGGRKTKNPSWAKYEKNTWPEGDIKEQLNILKSKGKEKEICYKLNVSKATANFLDNSFVDAVEHAGEIIGVNTRIPREVIKKYDLKERYICLRVSKIRAKYFLNLLLEGTDLIWRIEGNEIIIDVPNK